MKFFIDTANVDEIRKANDMGVISGVTTNPSLIAKEHKDYAKTLAEIASIVDGPISGEVKATTTDAETMVKEGEAIYALDPKHMVVKIPMTVEGLKAIKALSAKGIPTNCTLIFSANQALLAARAGAAYVSPFLGRLDDISQPGIDLVRTISEIADHCGLCPQPHPYHRVCAGRCGHRHRALQGHRADDQAPPHRSGHREVQGGLYRRLRRIRAKQKSGRPSGLPLLLYPG